MYDNENVTHAQALALINGEWDREVVPRLPPNVAEMAAVLGAFERSRKIRSCTDLLRGLLAYVSGKESLQATGAWAVLIKLADVSASDWCKRLCQARRWLEWLMTELIGSPASGKQTEGSHGYRVWLVDATHVGQEGGSGDDWRLHICYDWLAGKLVSLKVTDVQGAEGFWHMPDAPQTIRVADRAYGYRDELFSSSDHNQQVVVRICPRTFPCLNADGMPFDIAGWLREDGGSKRSRWVTITSKPRRGETSRLIRVRLVAQRISGAAQQRELEAAKRRASKHGHALSEATEQETEWILIATTLPERWSDEEVLLLYRARWFIERLFKLMKSLAHLARLPTRTPESSEAYLSAWFVLWLLQEEVQQELRQNFAELEDQDLWQEEEKPLSRWTMTALTLSLLYQQIRGVWTRKFWEECLGQLRRFCCPSCRHRTHWETFLRRRLTQGFGGIPAGGGGMVT